MRISLIALLLSFYCFVSAQPNIVYDKDSNSVQSSFLDGKKYEEIHRNRKWEAHGPYKRWKKDVLITDQLWENGQLIKDIRYFDNGTKMKEWNYTKVGNRTYPIGICKEWWNDGKLRDERKYEPGSTGEYSYCKEYFKNGKLKQEEYLGSGKGKKTIYFESGKKKSEVVYEGGKMVSGIEWDEAGNVLKKK